ncbi:MAG: PASTA domain-containing protein [Prevotella sp.]|nr:PASTA domain-containing protein [Prevotellaceae bacterium]MDY3936143.1 PASTA domain-containing protein [Prevotella sp.]
MASKRFFRNIFNTYLWGNIFAMAILVVLLSLGVRHGIDYYTHQGETIVVPDVVHKQLDDAQEIMQKVGLTIVVSDTSYVKELPVNCILEQTPIGGKRIKSTRVIYVTINGSSAPTLPLPDLADNSSVREAQALLLSMGFKVGETQYVSGERDWVYGVLVNGRRAQAGERIPTDALVVLQVGDGTRDANDTLSKHPVPVFEEVEVEVPEEEYEWVEVPVDEDGNELPAQSDQHPRIVPSVPTQRNTDPSVPKPSNP